MPGENLCGNCALPRDSKMPFTSLTITLTISGALSYTHTSASTTQSAGISCTFTQTLNRVPYKGNYNPLPPDAGYRGTLNRGEFWMYQDCCCRGRWKMELGLTDGSENPAGFPQPFDPMPQITFAESRTVSGTTTTATQTLDVLMSFASLQWYDPGGGESYYNAGDAYGQWPPLGTTVPKTPCRLDSTGTAVPTGGFSVYDVVTNMGWTWIPIFPDPYFSATGSYGYTGITTSPDMVWPVFTFSNASAGSECIALIGPVDPLSSTHSYTGTMTLSGADGTDPGSNTTISVQITIELS